VPDEFYSQEARLIHEARSVALRDIASATEDSKKVIARAAAGVKPGRRMLTVLLLVLVLIVAGVIVGVVAQQVETNHQNQVARDACALRNENGHHAKELYESLSRDAQSPLYRADFAKAAAALQFQDCSKI
jgi:uncharacterized protein HemX